jgi:hypothetical protein
MSQEKQRMTQPVLPDHLGQITLYLILTNNLCKLHGRKYSANVGAIGRSPAPPPGCKKTPAPGRKKPRRPAAKKKAGSKMAGPLKSWRNN